MKKILFTLLMGAYCLAINAQISPTIGKNYIKIQTARVATTNSADLDDYTKATIGLEYYDGANRQMQGVAYKASPTAQDIVVGYTQFDSFGRPQKTYLPVSSNVATGAYQSNVPTLAQTFYNNDTAPYDEVTTYESSPLSRTIKTVGAGQAFRPQSGTSKGVSNTVVTAGAGIRKYYVQTNGTIDGSTSFSNGDLMKSTTTDEQGNTSIVYTDKEGRTICQQVYDPNTSSSLSTVYVYDEIGRLVYIVPPKAYNIAYQFNETTIPNATYFEEGIYAFRYDGRGRVIATHKPGAGWSYKVYNRLNQVVISQNSQQRETNLWEWIKYDGNGRPVMSGTLTTSQTHQNLQSYFKNFTTDNQFEERSTATGNIFGYTARSFPSQIVLDTAKVKRINYYDDYSWVADTSFNFKFYKSLQWGNAKGLATGNIVRKLDDNKWLQSVVYYDDKNRAIQSIVRNRFGKINQTDYVYNFVGEILEERTIYRKASTPNIVLRNLYHYDHVGRKTGTVHYLNGKPTPLAHYNYDAIGRLSQKRLMQASDDIIIENTPLPNGQQDIANRYVLLNQGTITAQNGTYLACISPNVLQVIDYTYNIRGQLKTLNAHSDGSTASLFNLSLDYFETGIYYNGNLQRQTWQSNGSSTQRVFGYSYDGYNRLERAIYTGSGAEDYDTKQMTYDDNGNLTHLLRDGLVSSGSWGAIDNLSYTYLNNGSRLQGITDASNLTKGFKDNGSSTDYTYYADGSLKTDANKGISKISYNFLGLPDTVRFSSTQYIQNIYDAEGTKLSQKIINGAVTITTDYMGDLIYRNDSLKSILHDEGRIYFPNSNIATPHYQFFISDHLGNARIIIERVNGTTALVQENHYGAWGELLEGLGSSLTNNSWKFLYQANEWIDAFGYNTYDFHKRQYDPYKAQFDSIDPIDNYSVGGTVGMLNQPSFLTDKNGDCPWCLAGAIIGGVINVATHWNKIMTSKNPWQDGAVAFGIGAVAGLVTAATGGLASGAVGLGTTGVLAGIGTGAVAGAAGSATGGLIQGVGNAAYFGDSYSAKDWAVGVGFGAAFGGVFGGIFSKGKGFVPVNDGTTPPVTTSTGGKVSFGELESTGADRITNIKQVLGSGIEEQTQFSSTPFGQTAGGSNLNGSFSISNWAGYPNAGGVPRPTGPFRVLQGTEYDAARNAANSANRALRNANPSLYEDMQIHEIHPVKFGGSPIDITNKIALDPIIHRQYNTFWFKLQQSIKR